MQDVQEEEGSTKQLLVGFVDVYLDCGFLDWRVFVEVAEGLENVADI